MLAEPVGGSKIQAIGNLVVAEDRCTRRRRPGAGVEDARRSANASSPQLTTRRSPTASSTGARSPRTLRAQVPFVVAFATPKYCTSRTCGPVVDVVSEVRQRHASSALSFVHVEIYEGNDPAQGREPLGEGVEASRPSRGLPRRRDGRVEERFEGAFSVQELDAGRTHTAAVTPSGWSDAVADSPPTRSITTCGMRARGLSRRHMRTISAQSSGWIISSLDIPVNVAIGVSTKPGQIAIARTPSSSSSPFRDCVSEITAAFEARVDRQDRHRRSCPRSRRD